MKTLYEMVLFFLFVSLMVTVIKADHILIFLLGVELATVFVCLLIFLTQVYLGMVYFLVVLLTFSVCESVVGLVLFIIFSHSYSKDYVRVLSLASV